MGWSVSLRRAEQTTAAGKWRQNIEQTLNDWAWVSSWFSVAANSKPQEVIKRRALKPNDHSNGTKNRNEANCGQGVGERSWRHKKGLRGVTSLYAITRRSMAALVSDSFLRTCQMATVTSRGSRMLRRARAAWDWLRQRRLTFLAATTFRIHEKFSDQIKHCCGSVQLSTRSEVTSKQNSMTTLATQFECWSTTCAKTFKVNRNTMMYLLTKQRSFTILLRNEEGKISPKTLIHQHLAVWSRSRQCEARMRRKGRSRFLVLDFLLRLTFARIFIGTQAARGRNGARTSVEVFSRK